MGGKRGKKAQPVTTEEPVQASRALPTTASAVRDDPTLGYKLRVLIHDLLNISRDPSSEKRLNATTDEYYLSLPYFSAQEAQAIKNAVIDVEPSLHNIPGDLNTGGDDSPLTSKSVEDALRFFRASSTRGAPVVILGHADLTISRLSMLRCMELTWPSFKTRNFLVVSEETAFEEFWLPSPFSPFCPVGAFRFRLVGNEPR